MIRRVRTDQLVEPIHDDGLAAMRKIAARSDVAVLVVRRSPAVCQPVSSMLTTGEQRTDAVSFPCGPKSARDARWQIASTDPTQRLRPKSSRARSVMSRRETRLRATGVTTAAGSRDPNAAAPIPPGKTARVVVWQVAQHKR